ncbi:VanW family protein [Candidatus Peregrinibacteria bacterium]|nr:VanW family protein [Candidatus Peregrinibacteria bacterium]
MRERDAGTREYQRIRGCLFFGFFGVFGCFGIFLFPQSVAAAYPTLTYRYHHHLFVINPNGEPAWRAHEEVWFFRGTQIRPPQRFLVDGDVIPPLPDGVERSTRVAWNTDAIAATISRKIGAALDREAGTVTIGKDQAGKIVFEGLGLTGLQVDTRRAAALTVAAIEAGVPDVILPVTEIQPTLTVHDPELAALGIREVVAIGDSNFARSPAARRHNIAVGAARFNGHLIPQGATFSFNEVLGPVNAAMGYKKELVILGERTLPDYGGGLCQVSTTAYRGIWEYGFPIESRKNHSFAVQYYAPQGTDATIYPPNIDMKFVNDSPGALLMQTHVEGDNAYFIYYGTRDTRESEIVGPYTWNKRAPPPDKFEYTSDIEPGTTRVVGKAVPGLQAAWFRIVRPVNGQEKTEPVFSAYEARPNFTQIGVAALQLPSLDVPETDAGN